ncbi:MAG TPA: hypothetical protein VFK05_05480 [Polyangiaceae bacterium]|nr:hypothetical protein [Polyangiaceae bacterium]
MLRKRRAIRAGIISAFLLAPACTIKTADDYPRNDPTNAEGGKSGSAGGKAGSTSTTPKGEGGEAGQGPCAACASGFCLDDGTCVDCLPSNDHCPRGQYCSEDHECRPGCKNDTTSCASGVCGKDHNCKRCIDDSECTPEFVCSGGECTAACGADEEGTSASCSRGLTCCSARCSDLTVDERNCGACGKSCGSGQFCGRTTCEAVGEGGAGGEGGQSGTGTEMCIQCHDTTLANVCSVGKVTVILDTSKNSSDGNRVPGRALGAALQAKCPTSPVLSEAEQDSVEALNITTGRPVSDSSELLVVAGGPFFQNLEGYIETQRITPLYSSSTSKATEFRKADTNEVVVSLPIDGDHDSHDIFIIQFARDPASGSLILNEQGFWLSGTVAGAYQLIHGLLPDLKNQDKAWYAYEWTDRNGDKAPSLEEIELLDSGS